MALSQVVGGGVDLKWIRTSGWDGGQDMSCPELPIALTVGTTK